MKNGPARVGEAVLRYYGCGQSELKIARMRSRLV